MDTGIKWQVVYENAAEADACFSSLEYRQGVNMYDWAVHSFSALNLEHAGKVIETLMGQEEMKFRIHATPELQSELYHHHPIHSTLNENRSGPSTFEIHSIGHAHWKLLKDQQRRGFRTGGKVENAVTEVCQQAGVTIESSVKSDKNEEFDIMYQPGCSHWDFIVRYLIHRFDEAVAVTTRDCKSLKFEQLDKFEKLDIPTGLIIRNTSIDSPFQAHTLGGGQIEANWQNPYAWLPSTSFKLGEPIPGNKSRAIDVQRFATIPALATVTGNRNKWHSSPKTRSLALQGFVPPAGNFSPSYILKCDDAELNAIVVEVSHIIKNSKYQVMASLWDI